MVHGGWVREVGEVVGAWEACSLLGLKRVKGEGEGRRGARTLAVAV